MSQLMPLPLTVSCFSKIQIGFTFLVPAHLGSPGKRAVIRVCVRVAYVLYWDLKRTQTVQTSSMQQMSIKLNCRHCTITFPKTTRSSAIAKGPRDASCQLKSCQLPLNSAETTYMTSPDQIDGMKLEIQSEAMRDRQCALNHDEIESAPIVSSVINKPMTLELCISPVYRLLAVAKFSKSTQKLLK